MATNIPPHNLRETIVATIAYIDDPDIDTVGLMQHLKGPDFPTGGVILGLSGIKEAYETGRGRIRVRAKAHIEEGKQGKDLIIVTELPYMVKKGGDSGLIKKIADLHAEKKLTEITNIEDHSDRRGMRVVIELKRDANPKVVLNKLYKHTQLQTTFGVNMVALVDNVPRTLPLRSVIHNYVQHQREVIVRRSKHELRTLEARVHRLEGLLIALDHLDAVIALIRGSRDRDRRSEGHRGAVWRDAPQRQHRSPSSRSRTTSTRTRAARTCRASARRSRARSTATRATSGSSRRRTRTSRARTSARA